MADRDATRPALSVETGRAALSVEAGRAAPGVGRHASEFTLLAVPLGLTVGTSPAMRLHKALGTAVMLLAMIGAPALTLAPTATAAATAATAATAMPCKAQDDTCTLPPDPGPCSNTLLRWYYNPATGECEPFIYGGCGGNANNFATKEQCEMHCPTGIGAPGKADGNMGTRIS
ncbi:BPTI/Kunitz domain-containing protein [Streptomyces sp. NPDC050658]|uniref:BPTI/Kunitz domain-containing protein n=1 Tax=unclassified Streptomyces TaxID=2593676 RepID=UPI00343D689E